MPVQQPETSIPSDSTNNTLGKQIRNLSIVIAATVLSVALFLGLQTQTRQVSLPELAATSTPLEVALANGKPTLMEFYANWCTTCQAMAGDLAALKQQYADQLNFVMLNVDNSKWLPEILRYRVDGIPQFVFMDGTGAPVATAIGLQPRSVMESNLVALIAAQDLPYQQTTIGRTSEFSAAVKPNPDDPRSHGGQPANS